MLADIVLLLVVAFFVMRGCRKGLVKSIVGLVSSVLSLIVAILIYPVVSSALYKTPVYSFLVNMVAESSLMEQIQKGSGRMFEIISKYSGGDIDILMANPAEAVAGVMVNLLAFVLVLVLGRLIIWLIVKALNVVTKLPVLKQFNKLGGSIVGGLEGILILYVAFAIMVVFVPMNEDNAVMSAIEESTFANRMYNDNILLNAIDKGESDL